MSVDIKGQEAFVRGVQEQLEKKLRESEIAVVQHWQQQLAKLLALKPDGVASLQTQIRKVHDMMGNRVTMLKRG